MISQDLSAGLDKEKKSTSDLIIRLFPSLSTSSNDASVLEKEAKKLVDGLTEEGGNQEKLESQVGLRETPVSCHFLISSSYRWLTTSQSWHKQRRC